MGGFFSASARRRLPAAIQALSERHGTAFIYLRMKRDEIFIARELEISIVEARSIIRDVQDTLIKSGAIDLVRDPVFFPLDHPPESERGPSRPMELSRDEMDMADQVALDQFYRALAAALAGLDPAERRLLELWFNKEMGAADIVKFYKKLGVPLTARKPLDQTTAQDVFYEIEKIIKKTAAGVRTHLPDDGERLTPASLKAILNETGV